VEPANDISEFLTSQWGEVTPEHAGLPSFGKRRVPWLCQRSGRAAGATRPGA